MTKAVTGLCMGCMSVLGKGETVCPDCGYDADAGYDRDYISPGSVLGSRYIVGRLVHKNGEGARYIGYDNSTQSRVWIQEYFPYSIAQRGEETGTLLPLQGCGAQYKAQMSDFLDICNEVKRLSITEPVVPIDNVLTENNTIYAVYKDIDVVPLEEYLQGRGGHVDLEEAKELFTPLLNTLSNIHGHGQIHRGISPYTVYVDRQDRLYLWDFALAPTRTAGSELEAELFSGYSAPEQYSPSGWQGTWTDVYAVSALLYRALSGVVPPKSTLIGHERPLRPLEDLVMGLPRNISDAVGEGMRTSTDSRTQAIATLAAQLLQSSSHTTVYDTNKVTRSRSARNVQTFTPREDDMRDYREPQYEERPRKEKGFSAKYVVLALVLTVVILLGLIVFFMYTLYPELMPSGGASQSQSQTQSQQDEFPEGEEDGEQAEADVTVPQFVGRRLSDVMDSAVYLERYEFRVVYENSDDWDEGIIMDQLPVEGTEMSERGTITLTVSDGPEKVEMPDLTGLLQADAEELLKEAHEDIQIRVMTRIDSSAEPGTVVNTTPPAGEEFDPQRTTVFVFVNPEREESESSREESSVNPGTEIPNTNDRDRDRNPPGIIFHE